jgi:cytosine/adenosine deaminase-related metal-dependent hydrolase
MINGGSPWSLRVRWIFPVEGEAIEDGSITVQGDRIVAIEPHGRRNADLDLGNVAVIPGLVNAHSHLDLSGLRGAGLPTDNFTNWLRRVIGHRRNTSAEQVGKDIESGLKESLCHGTTLIGDISGDGASWNYLTSAPLRAVVFAELLGLPRLRAGQAWAKTCDWLRTHGATETCRPGLSPHAPYSVRTSLYRAAANCCREHGLALATHLAESEAELELLESRRGPFLDFLSDLGVWEPDGLARHPNEILQIGANTANTLFIHCNYLATDSPFPKSASVIYCPRTHAAFGHQPYPLRALLQAGVRVALATDSLASNPDLNVFEEIRFLHQHFGDIPGSALLRMGTLSGAEALGWSAETGSLSSGKSADLVVLPLTNDDHPDPYKVLFASLDPVRAVLWRGRWVYGRIDDEKRIAPPILPRYNRVSPRPGLGG